MVSFPLPSVTPASREGCTDAAARSPISPARPAAFFLLSICSTGTFAMRMSAV